MPQYRYRALTRQGDHVSGRMEAASEDDAFVRIRAQELLPITARPEGRSFGFLPARRAEPSTRDLSLFSHQLAVLLGAGLHLDRALGMLAEMEELRGLQAQLPQIIERTRAGSSLATALAESGRFPGHFTSLVRAGELGGTLPDALERLARYMERSTRTRDEFLSALIYPAILLVASVAAIVVVLVFVLPQFASFVEEGRQSLPLVSRLVIAAGEFLRQNWRLIAIALAALAGGIAYRWKDERFRLRIDALSLRPPLLGRLIRQMEAERFARTMGALLSSGIEVPSALGATSAILRNRVVSNAIADIARDIRGGGSLTGLLGRAAVFPAMVTDFVRAGEDTGQLGEMLMRLADIYEEEVSRSVSRYMALLTPTLTVLLGLLVAGVVSAVLGVVLSVNQVGI